MLSSPVINSPFLRHDPGHATTAQPPDLRAKNSEGPCSGLFADHSKLLRAPEFQAAPREKLDAVTLDAAVTKTVWRQLLEEWGK
jgi:hypothetical protein